MDQEVANIPTTEWDKLILLTFDGGGIRGYWSLLALSMLMDRVGSIEQVQTRETQDEFEGLSSFWPLEWPTHVSQVKEQTPDELEDSKWAKTPVDKLKALNKGKRYLPCHYFDYICGTSTGGLIATMLGRFRMTVRDCVYEYELLGERIFGKPRLIRSPDHIIGRYKFDSETLKKVFEEVTYYRSEDRVGQDGSDGPVTFATAPGLCKVLVLALVSGKDKGQSTKSYAIRSYRHRAGKLSSLQGPSNSTLLQDPQHLSPSSRPATNVSLAIQAGQNNNNKPKINYGDASNMEIWQVARAATAAREYFKPLEVFVHPKNVVDGPEILQFTDGGLGYNNPTDTAIAEIDALHGETGLDMVVSVGTAKQEINQRRLLRLRKTIDYGFAKATDTEETHYRVERLSKTNRGAKGFEYVRLNNPGNLNIPFDEWKGDTISKIKANFHEWAHLGENQDRINNCANELVRRRRERIRVDEERWERYAIGGHFYCPHLNCENDFMRRDEFREHMQSHPSFETDDAKDDWMNRYMSRWEYREGRLTTR